MTVFAEILPTLPSVKGWIMTQNLVVHQGFWVSQNSALKTVTFINQKNNHHPRPSDIFVASSMKTGTTWIKALIFAAMNRTKYDLSTNPLLFQNPHDCVPFVEICVQQNDLESFPSPRMFSTHIPYSLLPNSMTSGPLGCKYVYVCRNPKDVLVSKWKFMKDLRPKHNPPLSIEEAFNLFCEGYHIMDLIGIMCWGYWKASVDTPEKIMFLKYEDVKRDSLEGVRRVGEFLGKAFSVEEEKAGVMEGIVRLCSFENLRNLEVNKSGVLRFSKDIAVENRNFF